MNKRTFLYIGVEVFILLMAWITFSKLGALQQSAGELAETLTSPLNNLFIWLAILIFPLFILFLGFIIEEIWKEKQARALKAQLATEELLGMQVEETEDTEEAQREKDRLAMEQALEREQKLVACIQKMLGDRKEPNQKKDSEKLLSCIASVYEITQAEIFVRQRLAETDKLVFSASFAFYVPEEKVFEFEIGEGLIGQVAKAGKFLYLDELPQGYVTVKSGLGSATPNHLLIVPWKNPENMVVAVLEIASFKPFHPHDIQIIERLSEKIAEFYA